MGYFSLFEARLALYEIFDFVKVFARPNKKSRTPTKGARQVRKRARNKRESGERLFLLLFVGFGLLCAGFGLRFLVALRSRTTAAATLVAFVHHCY